MWIPQTVLNIQPSDENKRYWLIRFYDVQRSFAWIDRSKLDGLGDTDSELMWLKERIEEADRKLGLDSMYLAVRFYNSPIPHHEASS